MVSKGGHFMSVRTLTALEIGMPSHKSYTTLGEVFGSLWVY